LKKGKKWRKKNDGREEEISVEEREKELRRRLNERLTKHGYEY